MVLAVIDCPIELTVPVATDENPILLWIIHMAQFSEDGGDLKSMSFTHIQHLEHNFFFLKFG